MLYGGLLVGILTLAAGIVVLVWPKVLAYIVGVYLIIVGLIGIINAVRS